MAPGETSEAKAAPEPLYLVQRFVNSVDLETGEDELQTPEALRDWFAERGLLGGDDRVTAADLKRAIDVREGLRAVLLQNNGLPLDEELVERLDRAVGRASVRVRFAPDQRARARRQLLRRRRGDRAADGDRRRGRRARPLGAAQGVPARGMRVGVLRQLEELVGALVLDGVVRQHREGAGVPRAAARGGGGRRPPIEGV